jgi:hypothetical protein
LLLDQKFVSKIQDLHDERQIEKEITISVWKLENISTIAMNMTESITSSKQTKLQITKITLHFGNMNFAIALRLNFTLLGINEFEKHKSLVRYHIITQTLYVKLGRISKLNENNLEFDINVEFKIRIQDRI